MTIATTILFYLVIGAGVAVAVLLSGDDSSSGERTFRTLSAVLFWPLYLPILLSRPAEASPASAATTVVIDRPHDKMAEAIAQVEQELDRALGSLDGWAEGVLAEEHGRFAELRSAWRLQAERIRELDRLHAQPEFLAQENVPASEKGESDKAAVGAEDAASPMGERFLQCELARRENIARLRQLRRRMHEDLMSTLAWVRELVTMIHLAKFTGAPASRAEELVSQIAAAVEGLSEVNAWQDETLAAS